MDYLTLSLHYPVPLTSVLSVERIYHSLLLCWYPKGNNFVVCRILKKILSAMYHFFPQNTVIKELY